MYVPPPAYPNPMPEAPPREDPAEVWTIHCDHDNDFAEDQACCPWKQLCGSWRGDSY